MAEITANNIKFHYQLLGKGDKLVVFVHGLVMDNLSSWYFTLGNKVSGFAKALMYDLRGHGKTQRPETGYDADTMVADLSELLKALDITKKVYLVGNSYGGIIIMKFAAKYPERTAGLVLADAHIGDDGFSDEMVATLNLKGEARDKKIIDSFKHWLGRHSNRKRTRLAETAKAIVYGTSLIEDMKKSKIITDKQIQSIICPVLAIYGEDSDIREKGEALSRKLKSCEHVIFKGCTHSVIWEETETFCNTVIEWIQKQ